MSTRRAGESANGHNAVSLSRRLRLAQFTVFEKIVETGSLLAASRELSLSQPAVSKSMQELEHQLGGSLFTRGKNGITLTELGHRFARHARSMLSGLQDMAEDMNALQSGNTGRVVVGTMLAATVGLLPESIVRLREGAADIVVTVQVGPNEVLFPTLARGELDLVVGFLPTNASTLMREAGPHARFMHVPLYDEDLSAVVGREHPLAQAERVDVAELRRFDWIIPTPGSAVYPAVRSFFESHHLAMPRRRVESISILTNLGLLTRQPMVALMPRSVAVSLSTSGLTRVLPLPDLGPVGTVGYTLRAQRVPTVAGAHFISALHAVADELGHRSL